MLELKKVAVLGIGNILLKDDGIGVHIVNILSEENKLEGFEYVDGGCSTLDMLTYFLEYENVVVIDCLKGGCKAGTIYKIKPDDIVKYKKESLSIHDVQILDVVKIANMMNKNPKVIIYGIEPMSIEYSIDISSELQEKIPVIINYLINEFENLEKE